MSVQDPAFEVSALGFELPDVRRHRTERPQLWEDHSAALAQVSTELRHAAEGLFDAQPRLRGALAELNESGAHVQSGHAIADYFHRWIKGAGKQAIDPFRTITWRPEELVHVRIAPYDGEYADRPTPTGSPDAQQVVADSHNGFTNVWLAVVRHEAGVNAAAGIGVVFRPQIPSGTVQFRPYAQWHANWDLLSMGLTAHANGGFAMWAESWDLHLSDASHKIHPDRWIGPVFTDGSAGWSEEAHSQNAVFSALSGGIYTLPVTSQRVYRFWLENGAHLDASAGDLFGSQGNASFMTSIDYMVIQEYPA